MCCRFLSIAVSVLSLLHPLSSASHCLYLVTEQARFICVCCGSIGQLHDFDSVCLACAFWALEHDHEDSGVIFVVDTKYLLSSFTELRFRR